MSLNSNSCLSFSTSVVRINPVKRDKTPPSPMNPETMSVGNLGTRPVLAYSMKIGMNMISVRMNRSTLKPPKKLIGL